eukprot:RCo000636
MMPLQFVTSFPASGMSMRFFRRPFLYLNSCDLRTPMAFSVHIGQRTTLWNAHMRYSKAYSKKTLSMCPARNYLRTFLYCCLPSCCVFVTEYWPDVAFLVALRLFYSETQKGIEGSFLTDESLLSRDSQITFCEDFPQV